MKQSEMVGKRYSELTGDESFIQSTSPNANVLKKKEFTWIGGGERKTLSLSRSSMVDKQSGTSATVCVVRDITELRKHRDNLEQMVAERTADVKRLNRELRELARHIVKSGEEERVSIAREVHDELGQTLTAISLGISSLKKIRPEDRAEFMERVDALLGITKTSVDTVQKIASHLRPNVLDHPGLEAAIKWYAREFEKGSGIKCSIKIEPEVQRIDNQEVAISHFRILQESLTNVARHAEATEVDIKLATDDQELLLEVKDNGHGIREEKITGPTSYGLAGIRERALLWGGKAVISGGEGIGTTVTINIPVAGRS